MPLEPVECRDVNSPGETANLPGRDTRKAVLMPPKRTQKPRGPIKPRVIKPSEYEIQPAGGMTIIHINRGPGPVKQIRHESIGERWCFGCRKRREYFYIVRAYDCDPMDDYYGPWPAYSCATCGEDRLLFPGYERVWTEA